MKHRCLDLLSLQDNHHASRSKNIKTKSIFSWLVNTEIELKKFQAIALNHNFQKTNNVSCII